MFFRIVTLLLCLCLLLLGVLLLPSAFSHADENKGPEKPEAEASNVQTEEQIIKTLVETASIILIAKVQNAPPSPEKLENEKPSEPKIDLQKELDRAREETTQTFSGLDVGPLIRLRTIETIKGPQTQILSIPNTDEDLKRAMPGDFFLIMLGVNHPDAIKPISSMDDPWVKRVKLALAH